MDIVVRRNAFGRQLASFEADLDVPVLGEPPMPARVHPRAVDRAARGRASRCWPSTGADPVAARQGNMLVTAFHPELTDDRRVHALFVDMVRAAVAGVAADEAAGGAVRVRAQ